MLLPNLFIPGAQKSGTSTLFSWLAEHPECLAARPKEPMFFSKRQDDDLRHYSNYFAHGACNEGYHAVCDASTTYLSIPEVAPRIADALGSNLKFIFVLRHPGERAVSAYWHMAKRFHEMRSLRTALSVDVPADDAIALEEERIRAAEVSGRIVTAGYEDSLGDRHWSFRYLRNSLYLEDLRRFESCFGRSNMLVLLTDDLKLRPLDTYRRVAEFAQIDAQFVPPSVGIRHNVTKIPSQSRYCRTLYRGLSRIPVIGTRICSRIMNTVSYATPPVSADTSASLDGLFAAHNEELSRYLNRDLSHWSMDRGLVGDARPGRRLHAA